MVKTVLIIFLVLVLIRLIVYPELITWYYDRKNKRGINGKTKF